MQTSTKNVLESPSKVLILTAKALPSRTTATPRALFHNSIPLCKAQCCQRRSTFFSANFIPIEPFHNTVSISPVILEEDFRLREDAYLTFFSKINDSTTREAIGRFEVNIKNAIKHTDYVYCCCSQFVDALQLESISDNDAVLIAAFKTNIFQRCDLDVYGCCFRSLNFCHDCWTCINRSREPKFGIFNRMSQLCCQYYPALLEDLISAEEAVIAKRHSIVMILKLRPNNSFNLRSY